jgi:hypothetical protein
MEQVRGELGMMMLKSEMSVSERHRSGRYIASMENIKLRTAGTTQRHRALSTLLALPVPRASSYLTVAVLSSTRGPRRPRRTRKDATIHRAARACPPRKQYLHPSSRNHISPSSSRPGTRTGTNIPIPPHPGKGCPNGIRQIRRPHHLRQPPLDALPLLRPIPQI